MGETSHLSATYQPIEDYAVIGDLHTVALVGKNGSIDWCCLPDFDAPSVFGALLDAQQGGLFRIAPYDTMDMQYRQLYVPETNILVTRFLSREGIAEITDFMPIKQSGSTTHQHMLIRSLKVVRGSLAFEMRCRPAFNYARDPHTVEVSREGVVFHSKNMSLALSASVPLEHDGQGGAYAAFTLHTGQSARFFLQGVQEYDLTPSPFSDSDYYELLQQTLRYWRNWLAHCQYQGRWREMVQRSALVLKLLTYAPTGAIVAAPTTSLPEVIGPAKPISRSTC